MPDVFTPPSRKRDFNSVQLARWKMSGLPIDEYLKQSGLHEEGYVYDANKGRFDHPDTYLGEVDPDSIPSAAGKLRARAIQGMKNLANPESAKTDRGEGYYSTGMGGVKRAGQITETGEPISGWSDKNTPITEFKTNRYGSMLGTEKDAQFWDKVGAQRTTPANNFWSTRAPQPLNPTVRTDPTTGLPHVQIAARYGGGEGSVRYDLPASAPGYINGKQVEGYSGITNPYAPARPNAYREYSSEQISTERALDSTRSPLSRFRKIEDDKLPYNMGA